MKSFLFTLFLAAAAAGFAAEKAMVLPCPFLQESPKLDGKVGKAEYFDAFSGEGVTQIYPDPKGNLIPDKVQYFLGHTRTHLWIAFRIYRNTTPRSSTPGKGENCGNEVWKDDAIEIMLDVKDARKNGINLALNARGDYSDFKIYPPLKYSWNRKWHCKCQVFSGGWEGEIAIPFKDLATAVPEEGELWRFDFILNQKTPSLLTARLGDHPKGKWTDMQFRPYLRFTKNPLVPHITREKDLWKCELVNIAPSSGTGSIKNHLYFRTSPGSYREDMAEDSAGKWTKNSRKVAGGEITVKVAPYRKKISGISKEIPPGTYLQLIEVNDEKGSLLYRQKFPFRKAAPIELTVIHALLEKGMSSAEAAFPLLGEKAGNGKILFTLFRNGKLLAKEEKKVTAPFAAVRFPHGKIAKGDTLTFQAALYDAKGKLLGETRKDHLVPPSPLWQKMVPVIKENTVPYPWKKLEFSNGKLTMTDRTYDFGKHVLPQQITASGKELFAGKPLLRGVLADGKEVLFDLTGKVLSCNGMKTCAAGKESNSGILLESSSVTEYDGFLWNELSFDTGKTVFKDLQLLFRFPAERLLYFGHTYKGTAPFRTSDYGFWGKLPAKGLSLPFLYGLWLGDRERGFTLALESDEFWSDSGKNGAVKISRKGNVTELAINFLRNNKQRKGKFSYSFGIQATPVRPYMTSNHTDGIFTIGQTFQKQDPQRLAAWEKANLGRLAGNGGNYGILWSYGDEYFGHPFPPEPVSGNLRHIGMGSAARKEKYFYYCGWAGNSRTPEVEAWQEEMARQPKAEWGNTYLFKQCPAGAWSNMYLAGVKMQMEKYGFSGVYMDQTTELSSCRNFAHGCGYIGEDGRVHPTFPVRKMRKFFQKLYNLFLSHRGKENFMIYSHNSTQPIFTPVDSFISRRCALEIFGKEEDYRKFLSFDKLSAAYNPIATGIPMEATWWNGFHRTLQNNELMAYLWLFGCTIKGVQWKMDSSFREGYGRKEHAELGVMRALRKMDSPDLKFIPFWQGKNYETKFYSACWISHKGKKMLLILSNLSGKEQEGEIVFSRRISGIRDAVSGENPLKKKDHSFILTVPAKSYRAVTLEF